MLTPSPSRDKALPTRAELDEFRANLRRFIEREIMPFERRVMSGAERAAIQAKAKANGFWLLDVPEAFGGQGLGLMGMAVFWHEVSRTIAIPSRDHSLFGPTIGPILMSLSGELRARYLDPVLVGEKLACFAQTEPDAGRSRGNANPRGAARRPLRHQWHQALHHPCREGGLRAGDRVYRSGQGSARRHLLLSGRYG
jgi:acyl-CoA dehydrogenase